MTARGYWPSVRLFEAAACGVPIISDTWPGIEELFEPERELLLAHCADDVMDHLLLPAAERQAIGERGRARILAEAPVPGGASRLRARVLHPRSAVIVRHVVSARSRVSRPSADAGILDDAAQPFFMIGFTMWGLKPAAIASRG